MAHYLAIIIGFSTYAVIYFLIARYIYRWIKTALALTQDKDGLKGFNGFGERIVGILMLLLGIIIAACLIRGFLFK
jgi:hypothetical protein